VVGGGVLGVFGGGGWGLARKGLRRKNISRDRKGNCWAFRIFKQTAAAFEPS